MSTIDHPVQPVEPDHGHDREPGSHEAGPVSVSVVHDVRWPALVAVVCAALTVAWFARALATGAPVDVAMTLVPAAVGVLMLTLLRDARAPLMVADDEGVRVRRGVTWTGLRWQDVDAVEVRSRRGLRDGALVVHLAAPAVDLAEASWAPEAETPAGDPVAGSREVTVPLGPGTRVEVEGLTGDLVEDLASLSAGRVPVRVLAAPVPADASDSASDSAPDSADDEAGPTDQVADDTTDTTGDTGRTTGAEAAVEPAPATPSDSAPGEVVERMQVVVLPGASADVVLPEQLGPEDAADHTAGQPAGLDRKAGEPVDVEEGVAAVTPYVVGLDPDRATRPAARAEVRRETSRRAVDPTPIPAQRSGAVEVVTARIADLAVDAGPQPAADPVIGPVVAAARHRARLTVDTLSERTRIRPHVIECIEVDDFAACGGDFYARGHLRTLARVFGLDGDELVATYDARYASPEIEAKQVFEAELASGVGGGLRTASSGPRWSMLAAAVVVLVGIWGTARVFSDTPEQLVSPAPAVVDTAGLAGEEPEQPQAALGAIRVTAEGASPQVVVRDAGGRILWAGQLSDGQSQQVIGTAPFDVTASNGQAVAVDYLGKGRGTVGDSSAADNRRFG